MNWSIVKLIFRREVRDQLRDRRTLFTVAVLPLLLYPLMGMALLQVAQFMREHPTNVWVIGSENLPTSPALIAEGKISSEWTGRANPELIQLSMSGKADQEFYSVIEEFRSNTEGNQAGSKLVDELMQREMRARNVDLAVFFPKALKTKMAELGNSDQTSQSPPVYLFVNSASDKSNMALERVNAILNNWQQAISRNILEEKAITAAMMKPFHVAQADVAQKTEKHAAAWSKILPFIIMIWSLTGAFYPAVDLCAGEKERGTFETLLSSPAHRTDIAIGKLLTVMSFSMATSILNLLSMGFTGLFVYSRMGGTAGGMAAALGPPPIAAIGWLLIALIPISALFSAMALAAAAFARSSKEGQYYLIPLMMFCMPLMMVPMMPAAQMDLGTSLIPICGLMLLLRGLIEGQFAEVMQFAGPVCAVTLVCCWLSIRWVVRQFNSETVLFRASERFGIGAWFQHVMRERHVLPTFGGALLCAVVILVVKFFVGIAVQTPDSWAMFAKQTVIILVASIAMPAILMALILTRNARKSLRIFRSKLPVCAAACLAAICLHPLVMWLTTIVMYLYPPAGDLVAMQQLVGAIMADAPNIWWILAVFALAPAVFEELAFRGFILSGFQAVRNNWTAVLLSAMFFGMAHGVLQQSIITFFVGAVLGWIAIRTNSLLPCICYHATHNAITVLISLMSASVYSESPLLRTVLTSSDGVAYQYSLVPGILMSVLGVLLLVWMFNGNQLPSKQEFGISNLIARWRGLESQSN